MVKRHSVNARLLKAQLSLLANSKKPIIVSLEINVLPTHNASKIKVARAPLFGFVVSSKGSLQEESDLLKVHTDGGFDPIAYKLIKKSDYDFDKLVSLGHVIQAKPYSNNDTKENTRARWQFRRQVSVMYNLNPSGFQDGVKTSSPLLSILQ